MAARGVCSSSVLASMVLLLLRSATVATGFASTTAGFAPASAAARLCRHRPSAGQVEMKALTFAASAQFTSDPLSSSGDAGKAGAYFESEESLMTLLSDAESVEGSGSVYKAVLPMSSFPGINIKSTNFFNVDRSEDSLSIELLNSTSTATGPRFLVSIFEASQATPPKTTSFNKISVVGDGAAPRLRSDVSLEIVMEMPNWIPIPLATLEQRGSEALEKLLDNDVKPKLSVLKSKLAAFSP